MTELGFPQVLIEAIDALTKRQDEDYENYLERVLSNPIAVRVKIADMQDNMDMNRISNPTAKDYQRLAKYKAIFPRLLAARS